MGPEIRGGKEISVRGTSGLLSDLVIGLMIARPRARWILDGGVIDLSRRADQEEEDQEIFYYTRYLPGRRTCPVSAGLSGPVSLLRRLVIPPPNPSPMHRSQSLSYNKRGRVA